MRKIIFVFALSILAGCGADGKDGHTALVRLDEEPAGENCQEGGTAVHSGIDDDGDGQLSDGEITSTAYICNGSSESSGFYLESSDGKYIGEWVGTPSAVEDVTKFRNCLHVYNPVVSGIFSVELKEGNPCGMWTYFSGADCSFSTNQVYAQIPLDSIWRTFDPTTGQLYAPSAEVCSGTVGARLNEHRGTCEPETDPWTIDSCWLVLMTPSGEQIDFGAPPVLIKER